MTRRSVKKPVLIGQAPSRASDPRRPLEGRALARVMARCAGVPPEDYPALFDKRNLLRQFPGPGAGKGDAFPAGTARRRAGIMAPRLRGRVVIFLGKAVARAFGIRECYLRWVRARGFAAAVFPHPSGVNRWWNSASNRRRASAFVRRLLRAEPKQRTGPRRGSPGPR